MNVEDNLYYIDIDKDAIPYRFDITLGNSVYLMDVQVQTGWRTCSQSISIRRTRTSSPTGNQSSTANRCSRTWRTVACRFPS
ncbi:hypothetical protein OVA29_08755 [Exiguobacterium sp. SL14]|nr:hypothetical protein [Exiguobacterium sp. SL14]MCY1690744.1 hypothetical protein [Exiguobacterium sp. SL14]